MNRWWADGEQARTVLASLDDSDPAQAVASAYLAMHALQQEALTPLAQQTLTDGEVVSKRLMGVDLSGVADAISRAMEPELGPDVAEAYGYVLSSDWRDRAVEGAQYALQRWTRDGMPWPTAVQRLSAVVGLPALAINATVPKMMRPGTTELVAGDYGDRALLEHAQTTGKMTASGSVSKAARAISSAEFENEHPRGPGGRFRRKAKRGDDPGGNARQERRAERREWKKEKLSRVKRVQQVRSEREAREAEQRNAQTDAQGALQRMFGQSQRRDTAPNRSTKNIMDRSTNAVVDRSRKQTAVDRSLRPVAAQAQAKDIDEFEAPATVQPFIMEAGDKDIAFKLDRQVYIPMTRLQAMELISRVAETDNQFTIEGLRNEFGIKDGFNDRDAQRMIDEMPDSDKLDLVLLELNTVAAVEADKDGGFVLAGDGKYEINFRNAEIDPNSANRGIQTESDFYIQTKNNRARSRAVGRPVPIVSVNLANENDFSYLHTDRYEGRSRLPYDQDEMFDRFGGIRKALSGADLAEFNRNHPRNEDGEFTEKGKKGQLLPPDDLAARRAVRAQKRNEKKRRIRDVRARREIIQRRQGQVQAENRATRTTGEVRTSTAPDRSTAAVVDRSVDRSKIGVEDRKAIGRVYPKIQSIQDKKKTYDFANAAAISLDPDDLIDVFGVNRWGDKVDADMMIWDSSPMAVLNSVAIESGAEAIGDVAQWAKTKRTHVASVRSAKHSDEPVRGYVTEEAAMLAALKYISSLEETDVAWDAVVERVDHHDQVVYYPKMVGFEPDEVKVLVFGSPDAIASLYESGPDPSRLTMIDADSFESLVALRANDEALAYVKNDGHRANPALRAFWYGDRDD